MPQFSAVGGFQAGIVAIMVTYAVITLLSPVSVKESLTSREPVQDEIAAPPSKAAMDELMKQKLSAVAELKFQPELPRQNLLTRLQSNL